MEKRFVKRMVFYIPAMLFAFLVGGLAITFGISLISPMALVWIALFLASGYLLSKDKIFGGVLGMLPGFHLMYMSTRDTGQVINIELPLGMIILIFFGLCSAFVLHKRIIEK